MNTSDAFFGLVDSLRFRAFTGGCLLRSSTAEGVEAKRAFGAGASDDGSCRHASLGGGLLACSTADDVEHSHGSGA